MSKYPWEKDYKMTLSIYVGENEELSSTVLIVEVEGKDVASLKEQIDELILKTVPQSNRYLVEMLIEADGEYYDFDEFWVRASLPENKVYYEV